MKYTQKYFPTMQCHILPPAINEHWYLRDNAANVRTDLPAYSHFCSSVVPYKRRCKYLYGSNTPQNASPRTTQLGNK